MSRLLLAGLGLIFFVATSVFATAQTPKFTLPKADRLDRPHIEGSDRAIIADAAWHNPRPPIPQAGTTQTTTTPEQLFRKVSVSIYTVLASKTLKDAEAGEGNLGSAVAISGQHALTNCHVVDGQSSIFLVDEESGERSNAVLSHADPNTDRCILAMPGWRAFTMRINGNRTAPGARPDRTLSAKPYTSVFEKTPPTTDEVASHAHVRNIVISQGDTLSKLLEEVGQNRWLAGVLVHAAKDVIKQRPLNAGERLEIPLAPSLTRMNSFDPLGFTLWAGRRHILTVGRASTGEFIASRWRPSLVALRPLAAVRSMNSLEVGERVYTVGNPSGLARSFGEGLISGVRQHKGLYHVQTTAPISKGSSGGALIDARGALVGITTFLVQDSQNLNFAIAAEEYWR